MLLYHIHMVSGEDWLRFCKCFGSSFVPTQRLHSFHRMLKLLLVVLISILLAAVPVLYPTHCKYYGLQAAIAVKDHVTCPLLGLTTCTPNSKSMALTHLGTEYGVVSEYIHRFEPAPGFAPRLENSITQVRPLPHTHSPSSIALRSNRDNSWIPPSRERLCPEWPRSQAPTLSNHTLS